MKIGSFTFPDAALNQHAAILGKTGSGKTVVAKGIVEKLLDQHRQTCIVDPTGAWYGLRLMADEKSKGYDVVLLGGQHADIPLAERSGAAVARLVTEQGASVVIDTSGFTVGEYTRWFIDFAGTLYTTIRNPLHLVIDEAHYFAPQGGGKVDIDTGKMIHAANRLMSGGRSKGVRGMLITQRPAKLHKDSLTCADTLIAMRVIAPQDRAAIKEWIDGAGDAAQGKVVLDSLAQLKRGEGWVWYPEGGVLERVQFPMMRTYDSSATPAHGAKAGPKVGEIRLDEVKASMAEAVKEAEANDPNLLRAKITALEAAAKKGTPAAPAPKAAPLDTAPLIARATRDAQTAMKRSLAPILRNLEGEAARIGKSLESHRVGLDAFRTLIEAPLAEVPAAPVLHLSRNAATPKALWEPKLSLNGHTPNGSLAKGERAVLIAVAMYQDGITREQATILTGYKRSTRDAYIQRLATSGSVQVNGDAIVVTDQGIAALGGDYEPLPTGDQLREWWLGRLPEGERRVLEALIPYHPEGVDRQTLSESTGYKRSTRDAYIQRLSTRRIVEARGARVLIRQELFT